MIETLIRRQNPDGGWSYVRGSSWTEPTVYCVLALHAAGETSAALRGIEWLRRTQRPDGGFPPQAGVDQSTWVTALVALLPPDQLGRVAHQRSVHWLLGLTGKETSLSYRIREALLGNGHPPEQEFPGWPWIPQTAAWVGPTSMAVLALEKEYRERPLPVIRDRVDAGRNFLIRRMCADGGWNHGSAVAYGYQAKAYPETTGLGLAAMHGVRAPQVDRAIDAARRFLAGCRSADALCWLRLGLLAHDALPSGYCRPSDIPCRTVPETALDILVDQVQKGKPLFWA
jgi:squalene cyclase